MAGRSGYLTERPDFERGVAMASPIDAHATCQAEPNGRGRPIQFTEDCAADRRDVLRHRGSGPMGCPVAGTGFDLTENSSGRRPFDFLSCGDRRPVLCPHCRWAADCRRSRRSRCLHPQRSAYHVEQPWPARRSTRGRPARHRLCRSDAVPYQLRQWRCSRRCRL